MTQWGLDTLFNPAKRHMDEEKRRLQSTREEVGDSSGGKRIDLESGKVTIRKDGAPENADEAESEDAIEQPAAKKTEKTEKTEQQSAKTKSTPSPAAVRAAQRRGRQPR